MGFNANDSNTSVVKEGKLFTGLTGMRVVAINPTKAQLEGFGYKPQNEPSYLSEEQVETTPGTMITIKKVRMDFHLQGNGIEEGETVRAKIAFFLENQVRINKVGDKGEWINDLGRTAWGTPSAPPADLKWFDADTARQCKIGEADLHSFLINWLNISPNDEAKLESFESLFEGNYTELNNLLGANPNNEVRVLLTVRDGRYQSVYNRYFDRISNKRTSYWESHIKAQTNAGYPPKEDFQGSFLFQQWNEPTVLADVGGPALGAGSEDAAPAGDDPF
jgi:hypothetical protein